MRSVYAYIEQNLVVGPFQTSKTAHEHTKENAQRRTTTLLQRTNDYLWQVHHNRRVLGSCWEFEFELDSGCLRFVWHGHSVCTTVKK